MMISCIYGNFTTFFIMNQINLTCLISIGRINIRYNTSRSKLYAFNRIRHNIFCNCVKLIDFSIFTDQKLFQNICNLYSIYNLILYTFSIGCCI